MDPIRRLRRGVALPCGLILCSLSGDSDAGCAARESGGGAAREGRGERVESRDGRRRRGRRCLLSFYSLLSTFSSLAKRCRLSSRLGSQDSGLAFSRLQRGTAGRSCAVLLLAAAGLFGDRHFEEFGVQEGIQHLLPELGAVFPFRKFHQSHNCGFFPAFFENFDLVLT